MAVREKSSDHPREKNMTTGNKSDKKVYLVAQELKLARVLAGNNQNSRNRALKSLKKWFAHRSKTLPFTDNDFQRIWKGLYFSMWMSDKPLIQEECAENISSLIHFQTIDESLLFFKAGLTILINEWFGIDQLRLDKFLMLIRRLLRQMLVALKHHGLSKKNIDKFGEVISFTILNTGIHPPVGLFMHFTEIFLEEVAKVTKGNMAPERLVDFIRPFIKKLVTTNDGREIDHIRRFIFIYLMKQSDLGIQYQVKYDAWKKEGFPGTIDSMQKIQADDDVAMSSDDESSEDKVKEKPLDPRAGRVDVELPQIKFKAKDVINTLLEYKFDKESNPKSRKTLNELVNLFTTMSKGAYPLGIKRVLDKEKDTNDTSLRKATNRLIKFEQKLLGKNKKKRKRSSENDKEATEVPQKRRKVIVATQDLTENGNKKISNIDKKVTNNKGDVTEDELEKFIQQSEGGLDKKVTKKKKDGDKQKSDINISNANEIKSDDKIEKKLKRKRKNEINDDKKQVKKKQRNREESHEDIIDNIECVFERNSGTWVVYDTSKEMEDSEVPSKKIEISEFATSPNKKLSTASEDLGKVSDGKDSPSKKGSPSKNRTTEQVSSKSGLSPVRLFESPPKTEDLFPKSAWDEALQEGEYEICIPSKKHIAKLKRQAKKTNQNIHELINTSMKRIRGKGRLSLDSSLVKNPFSTPASSKKVKINTKLNMSQEIHEHVQQILSSPGIPYDANKKPLKPLLKSSATSTPVNPFYNKQLNVW